MSKWSQVAIQCEENAYYRIKKVCACNDIFPRKEFRQFDCGKYIYTLYWDWIDWDDDYESIDDLEWEMADLYDEHSRGSDDGLGFAFVRVGENGDIEHDSNDDMCVDVNISIDLPSDDDCISYCSKEFEKFLDSF